MITVMYSKAGEGAVTSCINEVKSKGYKDIVVSTNNEDVDVELRRCIKQGSLEYTSIITHVSKIKPVSVINANSNADVIILDNISDGLDEIIKASYDNDIQHVIILNQLNANA